MTKEENTRTYSTDNNIFLVQIDTLNSKKRREKKIWRSITSLCNMFDCILFDFWSVQYTYFSSFFFHIFIFIAFYSFIFSSILIVLFNWKGFWNYYYYEFVCFRVPILCFFFFSFIFFFFLVGMIVRISFAMHVDIRWREMFRFRLSGNGTQETERHDNCSRFGNQKNSDMNMR